MPTRHRNDAGQVTLLMVAVLALAVGAAMLIATLGSVAVDRAHARTAADAAALAGAAEGATRAGAVASANGGTIESYLPSGATVEVTVRVGGATATSCATRGG